MCQQYRKWWLFQCHAAHTLQFQHFCQTLRDKVINYIPLPWKITWYVAVTTTFTCTRCTLCIKIIKAFLFTHKPSRLTPRSSRDSPAFAREAVELDCSPSRNTEFRLVQIFVSWSCVSQCFPKRKWPFDNFELFTLIHFVSVSLRARKFADEILRSVEKTHSVAGSQETFASAFLGASLWAKMAKNGEDVHPF